MALVFYCDTLSNLRETESMITGELLIHSSPNMIYLVWKRTANQLVMNLREVLYISPSFVKIMEKIAEAWTQDQSIPGRLVCWGG